MSDPITCNWLVLGLALYLSKLAGGAGVPRQVPPPPWERSSAPQVQDLAPATSTSTGAHVSGPRLIFVLICISHFFCSVSNIHLLLLRLLAPQDQGGVQLAAIGSRSETKTFSGLFCFSPFTDWWKATFVCFCLTWGDQLEDFLTSPTKPWKNLVTLRHLDTGP